MNYLLMVLVGLARFVPHAWNITLAGGKTQLLKIDYGQNCDLGHRPGAGLSGSTKKP